MRIIRATAAAVAAAAVNMNFLPELAGHGADGAGTLVTAGSVNAEATVSYALPTDHVSGLTQNPWSKFYLDVYLPSSSNNRILLDLSADNGITWFLNDLFVQPGSGRQRFEIPLAFAAGRQFRVRIRSNTAAATVRCCLVGMVAQGAGQPPGFTIADTLLTADTAATHASATTVTVNAGIVWTQIGNALGQNYGAFLLQFNTSTNPVQLQSGIARLSRTAAHVLIGAGAFRTEAGGSTQSNMFQIIEGGAAAGEVLYLSLQAPAGADVLRVGLIGFR